MHTYVGPTYIHTYTHTYISYTHAFHLILCIMKTCILYGFIMELTGDVLYPALFSRRQRMRYERTRRESVYRGDGCLFLVCC